MPCLRAVSEVTGPIVATRTPSSVSTPNAFTRLSATATDLYTRMRIYWPLLPQPVVWPPPDGSKWWSADRVVMGRCNLFSNSAVTESWSNPESADTTLLFTLLAKPMPTNVGAVCIEEARDKMMDWAPRYLPTNGNAGAWHFSQSNPDDQGTICVSCYQYWSQSESGSQ
jgi:hypothetical protein